MKAKIITSQGPIILPIEAIKSVSAVSQCNIVITKQTGEQLQGISLEFIRE